MAAASSSSSSSVIFRGGLSSSPHTNFTHGRRNHNGFFSLTFSRSSVILPRVPITLTLARRKNSNSPVPSNKKKKTKKRLPENDDAGGERFDDDAVEALFYQLEEDLKNDLGSDEGDDEISEEDLARLEQELAEAFGISAAGENEDMWMYCRFSFDPDAKLGLDVASCLLTRAPQGEDAEGKKNMLFTRKYTPISDPDSKGYVDLLIKIYPEGKMSQHFASLKPGDVLEIKGPIEKLRYTPNMKKHIGMIAGGSGITPMLQIIEAILKNPDDKTKVTLIYANVSPDDILLKEKLDLLASSNPNLKIFYTVDNPTKNWRGGAGFISEDMVVKGLPAPSEDAVILVCGPPGMMEHISGGKAKDWTQGELKGLLKQAGYTEDMVYKF